MKGWHIFLHSLKQVTGNLRGAIKISAVPFGIQIALTIFLFGLGTNAFDPEVFAHGGDFSGGFALSVVLVLIVAVFTSLWIAVSWHRFVLLGEESPTFMPVLKTDRIWAYFVRSLGIVLMMLVAMIPLSIVASLVAVPFVSTMPMDSMDSGAGMTAMIPFMIVMAIIVYIPLVILSFRLSGSLPGAALDSPVDFWAGWRATKGANFDMLVLAVVVVVAHVLAGVLSMIPVVGIVIEIATTWLIIMVGASILTTIYGHYIEGRAISGIEETPNPYK